jgi:hypothetical protein
MPSSSVPDSTAAAKPPVTLTPPRPSAARARARARRCSSPPRAASRSGYGNLVLEQVARDAGLTLPDRSSRGLRVTLTTDERKPRMSLFLRRLALLGAAVVAFVGGRAMRTAVQHMAVGRLPL